MYVPNFKGISDPGVSDKNPDPTFTITKSGSELLLISECAIMLHTVLSSCTFSAISIIVIIKHLMYVANFKVIADPGVQKNNPGPMFTITKSGSTISLQTDLSSFAFSAISIIIQNCALSSPHLRA